jgi:broad specificity phosphatase PhoE
VERSAADILGVVDDIRANHAGQKVLVVGHSNTVPQIVSELGGPAVGIPENEFDNLYVLTLCRCFSGEYSLVNQQYGAPSP